MNVPVAHVQGGEVTGSIDEKVRHAVTKLANLHFVANSHCAERVIRMGESPSAVHVTGCPSIDLAAEVMSELRLSFDPFERYGGAGPRLNLDEQPYLVVMQHAVTTEYDVTPDQIRETVAAILDLQMPTLWFWPNVDAGSDWVSKGIRLMREHENPDFIHFFRNMPPEDFLRVLAHAACIVGNSSAAIREGSFLGVPAVNIGTRQAGRDRGRNVMDVEYDRQQIISAVQQQVHHGHYPSEHIYGDGRAGERIAEHLATAKLTVEKRLYY
jgi:UDP-hydrolysing UDP-N-acetyl-D-glucosamine 2-epimerase